MTKQTTETGRTLVQEGHYEVVVVEDIQKREIKSGEQKFIIYEWTFKNYPKDGESSEFKISLFSSQMADLLRAVGAKEVTPNKFEWDDEKVLGTALSFNVVHVADKKGTIREQLSDIKFVDSEKQGKEEEVNW